VSPVDESITSTRADLFERAESVSALNEPVSQSLSNLLRKTECTVLVGAGYPWASKEARVMSSPIIELFQVFDAASVIESAVSFVSVTRSKHTELHYHDSHSIGMIVGGAGSLIVPDKANTVAGISTVLVKAGDVVTIPRGALHALECEPSGRLDFIALEFRDSSIGGHLILGPDSISEE
jgi:mannose-6-phosphate isomerase-like protein (cupin superfamily)